MIIVAVKPWSLALTHAARIVVVVGPLAFAACSDSASGPDTANAERGRQVYLAQCTVCHGSDPAQAGPVGPPIKRASRELLEAKVLRGTYPEGYKPQRPTALMPPQPALAPEIPALAAYLR
jgi:mono/diheme cytochrome c family protein